MTCRGLPRTGGRWWPSAGRLDLGAHRTVRRPAYGWDVADVGI